MKVIGETMFTFLPHSLPSAVDLPCSPRLEVITSGIAQMTWLGAPMAKDPESPPVLTIRDIAELLHLSPRTVERMIRRKKIPAYKVGGQWRVSRSRLARWIQRLNKR
jgi:excisionase family DNA binding protein